MKISMWEHLIIEIKAKQSTTREVKSAVGKLLVFSQTNQGCPCNRAFEKESTI